MQRSWLMCTHMSVVMNRQLDSVFEVSGVWEKTSLHALAELTEHLIGSAKVSSWKRKACTLLLGLQSADMQNWNISKQLANVK